MEHIYFSFIVLLIGLGLVTVVDVVGSIVSRLLKFQYGYFIVLSFIAYIGTAYSIAVKTNSALLTMLVVMIIGFYDATIGWTISQKLKANYEYPKGLAEKITAAHRIFVANIFAILCGIIGYIIA